MTTINANNITAKAILAKMFGYKRTDNYKDCIAMELVKEFRTIDEPRGTKYENSKGFVRMAQDVREACKAIGVKAYYSSNIEQYVKDDKGNFVIENGLPKKTKTAGWLFEVAGKDSVFNKELCEKAAGIALDKMVSDVKNSSVLLKEVREKKPATKKATKSELEAENNLLKKQMEEMMKRLAALEKNAK